MPCKTLQYSIFLHYNSIFFIYFSCIICFIYLYLISVNFYCIFSHLNSNIVHWIAYFPFLFCIRLLYPRHTKYVGVYSFRPSVRPSFVRTYVRSFVFPSQGQSFCVKFYKTSYFKDPLMDFIHIWHDGRYRSKVFINTIPTPG